MLNVKYLITIIMVFISSYTYAEKLIEVEGNLYKVNEEKIIKSRIPDSYLIILNTTLGRDSLEHVLDTYGAAQINVEEGISASEVCYASNKIGDTTAVVFLISVLGGGKTIDGYTIYTDVNKYTHNKSCKKIDAVNKEFVKHFSLEQSFDRKEIMNRLGNPTWVGSDRVLYYFETDKNDNVGAEGVRNSTIEVRYRGNSISRVYVTDSYSY